MPASYVAYNDPSVEPAVPGEADKTRELIEVMGRMQEHNFSHHRHGFRGTHVKTQGIVKGELAVLPNLPPHLAQGIFSRPLKHPIAIRYANEPSFLQDDRAPGPRGCGMKVFNIDGAPFLDEAGRKTSTQDFTFNNAPILELTDLPTTLEIIKLRESHFDDPDGLKAELKKRKDADLQFAPSQLPNQHFMSYVMYSQSAYRFGDYVVKYALFPAASLQKQLEERKITDASDPEQHSHWMQEFFRENAAEYEFRVQLLVDPEQQPVEDCSKLWSEEKFPFETVARVTIPPQDSFDPKRRAFWDDRMKLNVWYGLEAHQPLGSANRLRKSLYQASSAKRASMNATDFESVTSIDQIP